MVPKDDGTDRIVIDYIPFNKKCEIDTFRPPGIPEILQLATQHRFFSKVDITDAYAQLAIHPQDWHLFAFHTPWGIYTFTRMSQGWSGAPAHWQHYIQNVLRKWWGRNLLAWHDDIIIFTNTLCEHHVILRKVLLTLKQQKLDVNERKSTFAKRTIQALGTQISAGCITPIIPTDTIRNWKPPRSKLQLQQFLGTVNAFRNHIPNLSQMMQHLNPLVGDTKWRWQASHLISFQQLKTACIRAISLTTHKPNCPQHLFVDASDRGLGVVLKEFQRVVAIASRQLTTAEQGYDTKERELLAVRWAIEALFHFTNDATTIHVWTDHLNLVDSLSGTAARGRINRHLDWLANFHITWHHVPGRLNPADGPSRLWDESHCRRRDQADNYK